MISWIVLSKSWVELDVDSARARLDAVFPGEFLPPTDGNKSERFDEALHRRMASEMWIERDDD